MDNRKRSHADPRLAGERERGAEPSGSHEYPDSVGLCVALGDARTRPNSVKTLDVWSSKVDAAEMAREWRYIDTEECSKDGWRRQEWSWKEESERISSSHS